MADMPSARLCPLLPEAVLYTDGGNLCLISLVKVRSTIYHLPRPSPVIVSISQSLQENQNVLPSSKHLPCVTMRRPEIAVFSHSISSSSTSSNMLFLSFSPFSQFFFFFLFVPSQRRLDLLRPQRRANLLRRARLRARGQQLAARLAHVVLLLHGRQLLVLGEGEGKGHAEEERRRGDDPGALAAKGQRAPGGAGDGVDAARDPAARRRRDDVAEGVEALGERLFCGVEVGLVGDFGF